LIEFLGDIADLRKLMDAVVISDVFRREHPESDSYSVAARGMLTRYTVMGLEVRIIAPRLGEDESGIEIRQESNETKFTIRVDLNEMNDMFGISLSPSQLFAPNMTPRPMRRVNQSFTHGSMQSHGFVSRHATRDFFKLSEKPMDRLLESTGPTTTATTARIVDVLWVRVA
jgi:hypothetical protein